MEKILSNGNLADKEKQVENANVAQNIINAKDAEDAEDDKDVWDVKEIGDSNDTNNAKDIIGTKDTKYTEELMLIKFSWIERMW